MHLQLVASFCMGLTVFVEITNAHDVFKSLRAHCAGVHAQAAADCAGNTLHPLKSTKSSCLTRVGDLSQFRADTCADFVAIDLDLVEIAAAGMNHHATNATVAHEQI